MSTRIRHWVRRGKRLVHQLQGRDVWTSPQIRIPCEILGSEYGGWAVDTRTLNAGSIVYGVGVGQDVSFDLALIQRFGLTVHAFDPTPLAVQWVAQQKFPPQFCFHPIGLADFDGTAMFDAPHDPGFVSFGYAGQQPAADGRTSASVKRLATLMKELGHQQIDVLKMDIEGAEYGVVADLIRQPIPIRQLLIEFHHFSQGYRSSQTRQAIDGLNRLGFRIFHISPTGLEYSFVAAR